MVPPNSNLFSSWTNGVIDRKAGVILWWINLGLLTPAFHRICTESWCSRSTQGGTSQGTRRPRHVRAAHDTNGKQSASYLVCGWAGCLVRASLQRFRRKKGMKGQNVLWRVRNVSILEGGRGTGSTIQWAVWHSLSSVCWFLWNVTYFLVAQERKAEKIKAVWLWRALRPSQCQEMGLLWKKTSQRKVVRAAVV